jgi:5-methyltetrahydrofolate--homocysteine methyltransferase
MDITISGKKWNPSSEVLVADGAWGTEFLKHGLRPGDSPEEWNLRNPQTVEAVARSYVEAGSSIILTNTFGGTRFQLERHGLAGKVREVNKAGAELSLKAAAGRPVLVAGDMGPSGKLFIMGEVSEDELFSAFSEQAQALKEAGVHWLVIETMTDMGEMEVAVRAAAATGLPVVASMTYEKNPTGYRTVMGHAPEDCVAAAKKAGAAIVGANCGTGVDSYVELAKALVKLSDLPVWIKGNAGLPELVDGQAVYRMTPEVYCSYVPALLEAGVSVIGGCCGTNPSFIRQIRALVDGRKK